MSQFTATQLLEAGLELVRTSWTTGAYFDTESQRVCAVGAVARAKHPDVESIGVDLLADQNGIEEAVDYLFDALPENEHDFKGPYGRVEDRPADQQNIVKRWCVVDFNDHSETTHEDVIALFERALERSRNA